MMSSYLKKNNRLTVIILSILLILVSSYLVWHISNVNRIIGKEVYSETKRSMANAELEIEQQVKSKLGVAVTSSSNLPENNSTNKQAIGTQVALKDGWGEISVYAVSDGEGNTIPVPQGFYYVGGTINNGVIISDNEQDKYDGKTDKTTWEYTTSLKGNQFVWIPCSLSEYKKSDVWNETEQTDSVLGKTWWDTTTYSSELPQISKYGGYYVGRYEAGLASTIPEFTSKQQHTGENQVYNLNGIPQSKAGVVPWNFIDWNTAKANAESMYNTNSVSSGLITGTQWDVMLNKMVEYTSLTQNNLTNSASWGNHFDNSITYTGRKAIAYLSGGWYLQPFGGVETSKTTVNNYDLLTTGASSQAQVYHIFDVAGNLWEWTEEESKSGGNAKEQYRVRRGGAVDGKALDYPVCYRIGNSFVTITTYNTGYRVVLYIK